MKNFSFDLSYILNCISTYLGISLFFQISILSSSSSQYFTPVSSASDVETDDTSATDTLYVQGAHGELVALTPEQRQLRQRLADAGCLVDSGTHENSRNFVRTRLAQATGAALQTPTGLHNPHFDVNVIITSTPLGSSPMATSRPAPPLPSKPPPSLVKPRSSSKNAQNCSPGVASAETDCAYLRDISKKVAQVEAKKERKKKITVAPAASTDPAVASTSGAVGSAPEQPDMVDLNQTMSHSQVFSAVGRRARRNAISLFNACRCRLGLDYPQT